MANLIEALQGVVTLPVGGPGHLLVLGDGSTGVQIPGALSVAGVAITGSGSSPTVRLPLTILNPQVASNAGNAFFNVTGLTNWDAGHYEYVKSVVGTFYAQVAIPHNLSATPNAKLILSFAANATANAYVFQVGAMRVPNGDTVNTLNASFTTETKITTTVPATAYTRQDVTFPAGGGNLAVVPQADDLLIVELIHLGTDGSDTLAVNLMLFEATLQVGLS